MKLSMPLKAALALALLASSTPAWAQTKIKIGFTPTTESLPDFVAVSKGFFKKHGIDAELILLRGTSVIVPGIVSDEIQMGAVTAPILLQAIDSGLPLVGISGMSVYTPDYKGAAIIARNDSGVKTAADMMGKRFLTGNINSITTLVANYWLRDQKVDQTKVKFVEVPMGQVSDVLKAGSAEVALQPDPHLSRTIGAGTAYVVRYVGEIVPNNTAVMVNIVSREWAEKNPEAVKCVRAAVEEAAKWANDNRDEALAIAAEYIQVKPDVVKNAAFPPLNAKLTADQMQWWIAALKDDKLLRTDVTAAKAVLQ